MARITVTWRSQTFGKSRLWPPWATSERPARFSTSGTRFGDRPRVPPPLAADDADERFDVTRFSWHRSPNAISVAKWTEIRGHFRTTKPNSHRINHVAVVAYSRICARLKL